MKTSNHKNPKRSAHHVTMTSIIDLPEVVFVNVAKFLPTPSVALFVAALTTPSSSWREPNRQGQPLAPGSVAIIKAGQWDILDFADVETRLANELTDNDLYAVLVCIDAVNKLKRLKLAGCVNIIGHGLGPLRNSIALEQIDLSIAKQHESPLITPDPLIAEAAFIPILYSIMEKEGNSLKQLQLPRKEDPTEDAMLSQFLERYNGLLNSRPFSCSGCDGQDICHGTKREDWLEYCPGVQQLTCYSCMDNFCGAHGVITGGPQFCWNCYKNFCRKCAPLELCYCCFATHCNGCMRFMVCEGCGRMVCNDCNRTCDFCSQTRCRNCVDWPNNWSQCDKCKKSICETCEDAQKFHECEHCRKQICFGCRLMEYREAAALGELEDFCIGCTAGLVPQLLQEYDASRQSGN